MSRSTAMRDTLGWRLTRTEKVDIMGRIRLTRLVVVFGLLLALAQVAAQAPDIAWTRQFGTSGWDKAAG